MSRPHAAGPDPGLCGECRHARVVRTRRGSCFYLCERSHDDASFPRYPRLPVVRCRGFAPRAGEGATGERTRSDTDPSEER